MSELDRRLLGGGLRWSDRTQCRGSGFTRPSGCKAIAETKA
jgi:hypothetical protein